MQKVVAGIVLALVAVGCGDVVAPTAGPAPLLAIREAPSPFTQVTAGEVVAMIPDEWMPVAADETGSHEGFFASPEPEAWQRMDGSVAGISATWVDATRVGVPSDMYYLAANGPVLGRLTNGHRCIAITHRVVADHQPAYLSGVASDGAYIARGEGTCIVRGVPTRWAYFVAAPGFGPAREIGIPASGLYVVVAVLPESKRAHIQVHRLIDGTTFGGAQVADFIEAASATRRA